MAFISSLPLLKTRPQNRQMLSKTVLVPVTPMRNQRARYSQTVPQMISPEIARSAIAVYGALIVTGSTAAFLRSGSKPSLISGLAAGIVLGAAYIKESIPIALGTSVALLAVFLVRLVKTKKFVPAGALAILSLAAAAIFAAAIYT